MSNDNDGKKPWPDNIDETAQGHPVEPWMDDDVVINFDDETLERAREALRETDQHDETEYLSALIKVIQFYQDPEFGAASLL